MRSTTLQTFRASSTSRSSFGARLVPHCCHQQFDGLWTLLRKAPSNKITDPDHAKGGKPGIQKTQSKRKHRDVVVVVFLQPFSHFQSLSACTSLPLHLTPKLAAKGLRDLREIHFRAGEQRLPYQSSSTTNSWQL